MADVKNRKNGDRKEWHRRAQQHLMAAQEKKGCQERKGTKRQKQQVCKNYRKMIKRTKQ